MLIMSLVVPVHLDNFGGLTVSISLESASVLFLSAFCLERAVLTLILEIFNPLHLAFVFFLDLLPLLSYSKHFLFSLSS